jgi:hypothetical protein
MRAVREVKETVNLATQYMQAGYDPQALIARLAEIVCHDNFTEMHAVEHHQSIVEEYNATREPRPVASACDFRAIFGPHMCFHRCPAPSSDMSPEPAARKSFRQRGLKGCSL